jgi:hypothetical protein
MGLGHQTAITRTHVGNLFVSDSHGNTRSFLSAAAPFTGED